MAAAGTIALVRPAMLAPAGDEINGAVRVYAGYLVSRNLAIAAMLLGALAMRARGALSSLMLLVAVIQILDAVIDCIEGRWMLVPGVLLLGIGFSIGAARLSEKVLRKAALRDKQTGR
jgi:hypothetical protein